MLQLEERHQKIIKQILSKYPYTFYALEINRNIMWGNKKEEDKYGYVKKQEREFVALSAHQRETVHHILFTTMEWLEKYIEIAGYYPDWENRKQIKDNGVKRTDVIGNPEEAEKWFSTTLFGLRQALEGKPASFHEELKAEFYQWIDVTGININNCPERLKHILYGFNELLDGKGEKIMNEMLNKKETLDVNSPDYAEKLNSFYFAIQNPLDEGRKREQFLEGKRGDEINIGSKFGGVKEQGEQVFNQIARTVSNSHGDFHFFSQKEQKISANQVKVLTDKIKQNLHEWSIKELVTFKGYHGGKGEVKELALVHERTNLIYNWQGHLEVDSRTVYFKKDHLPEEWNRIEHHYLSQRQAYQQQSFQQQRDPAHWKEDLR